ncbi:hypothetical protein V1517DRAFT_311491 [Lipomyces orientalis]|uniref:Uncharacterized protein n=1 Tax=Lipomyces orientalis TaxID=1233043 RepID=A0ACC3TYU5_9ASCO
MNYLTSRSLYDPRSKYRDRQRRKQSNTIQFPQPTNQNRRKTGLSCASRTPDPKLKGITLCDIDPRRKLVDHVVLGCSATYPFYLISLFVPKSKYSADESFFSSSMDGPPELENNTVNASGLAFLWRIKRSSGTIDYATPPQQPFPCTGECTELPVLAAFSAWSLSDNSLVQVLLRSEEISPVKASSSFSWMHEGDPVTSCRNVRYDRELVEFRCSALERVIVCAGTGEFDHAKSHVSFELLDKFGIIALSLNSRVFLYQRKYTPAVRPVNGTDRRQMYWHPIAGSEIEFQNSDCGQRPTISIVELDYFISDTYPQHFKFTKKDENESIATDSKSVNFDEFATMSMKAAAHGYEVVFGALDSRNALYLTCVLHLNIFSENITVQKLYRSDVSHFRGMERTAMYNAHDLLNLALQSHKFRQHVQSTNATSSPNVKKLESYRRNMTSVNRIELYELGMALRNS